MRTTFLALLVLLSTSAVGLFVARHFIRRWEGVERELEGSRHGLEDLVRDRTDELSKANARLEAFMRGIPDLLFQCDESGTLLDFHSNEPEHLYVQPGEFLGRNIADVLPKEVAEAWLGAVHQANATGELQRIEYELEVPAGRLRYEARVVAGQSGEAYTVVQDVTDRKEAEEALRESEEQYRALTENSPDYILRYDRDGRHLYVNKAAATVTGLEVEEMLGKTHRELGFPEDLCALWEKNLRSVFETGQSTGEIFEWDSNAGTITLDWRIMPELDANGRVISVLGVSRDISGIRQAEQERIALERQVQHSQKLESLGVLAGGIAHDFNNLLTSILGNAELSQMELPSDSPIREYTERIQQAAMHAASLTKQMLAYSGRALFTVEPLDLESLVSELAPLLEAAIPKGVELEVNLQPGLLTIDGDSAQMRQVIMNLIINAGEAIGDGSGMVTVTASHVLADDAYLARAAVDDEIAAGEYVCFEVTDTGTGMDEVTIDKIFEPFFSTKFQGRGLGLAAVRGIIRGHNGALSVTSELGQGTTFKVLLPASEHPIAATLPGETSADASWRGTGSVLVVDDEEGVRSYAGDILGRIGFDVLMAADGRQGVEVFREHAAEIVLVLLDLTMPHLDGEAALGAIRSIRPDVRVILCSGFSEQDVRGQFVDEGQVGFLQKPFKVQSLKAVVREALWTSDVIRSAT